jgi:hypothetical protein
MFGTRDVKLVESEPYVTRETTPVTALVSDEQQTTS